MCLAVPGLVQSIEKADPSKITGKVSFAGLVRDINMTFVPDIKVGEYVIVHVGMALSKVDEAEAQKILEDIKMVMGEVKDDV